MTIALGLMVHEGVVLASDSAASATGTHIAEDETKTAIDIHSRSHARKIFPVGKNLAAGAVGCGVASLGKTIEQIVPTKNQ